MPGLVPGIHAVASLQIEESMDWIAGLSPAIAT
jgi:hypothetical protein